MIVLDSQDLTLCWQSLLFAATSIGHHCDVEENKEDDDSDDGDYPPVGLDLGDLDDGKQRANDQANHLIRINWQCFLSLVAVAVVCSKGAVPLIKASFYFTSILLSLLLICF
ncbi:unnamed protein product [Protopolystoma xenopodis]|uniref:Uncharacterized protein n=1 Tax=Protopolystoma xenopodis TaxID=117903 RepID=A0A448XHC9_9PLAT|nr:unnamed protein product [Protopolystoma xenopodis]